MNKVNIGFDKASSEGHLTVRTLAYRDEKGQLHIKVLPDDFDIGGAMDPNSESYLGPEWDNALYDDSPVYSPVDFVIWPRRFGKEYRAERAKVVWQEITQSCLISPEKARQWGSTQRIQKALEHLIGLPEEVSKGVTEQLNKHKESGPLLDDNDFGALGCGLTPKEQTVFQSFVVVLVMLIFLALAAAIYVWDL